MRSAALQRRWSVQLSPDGPDLPLTLLRSQREGNVIFVVGAGVSATAGLPLFAGLVKDVYADLGQALPGEADSLATLAEEQARSERQYDRLIGLLEQRLVYRDRSWRQPSNVVRDAVAARLMRCPKGDLAPHLDLLDLSRGQDGRPRLVTTNFDTLFEQAWTRSAGEPIESAAGAAIPQVGSHDFAGVLHLHGHLENEALGLKRSNLVLSSPDFGEAYMRAGWASRTVYDLLRRYTLVLVGYSADDPPMRYMLEATEEGRLSFPDLKPAYALVADEQGDPGAVREAWTGKGLQPLVFPAGNGDFRPLYDTLRAWADLVRHPLIEGRRVLANVTAVPFVESTEGDREKFAYLSREITSVAAASAAAADPAWVRALEPAAGTLDWSVYYAWFRDRLTCRQAVEVALELGASARAELARAVELHLRLLTHPLPEPYHRFWTLFTLAQGGDETRRHRLRPDGLATNLQIREATAQVEPRLRIDPPFQRAHRPDGPVTLHDLAHFHFQAPTRHWQSILDRWPKEAAAEERLIRSLDRSLSEALELAVEAGLLGRDGDLRSMDLAMVHAPEPGEGMAEAGDRHTGSWRLNAPDHMNDRLAPNVRLMTGLWRRLADRDAARAGAIASTWATRDELVFRRLGAWASSFDAGAPARSSVVGYLATTTRDRFWNSDLKVEFARFYCSRWNSLPGPVRKRLEAAILGGRRLEHLRPFARKGHLRFAKALYTVRELARIQTAGGRLSRKTSEAVERLQERYPGLPREMPLLAHLYSASWSGSGYSADIRALENVPDDRLIEAASAIEESNRFDQADVWRVLAREEPGRVFRALEHALAQGDFPQGRWQSLLGLYGARPDDLPPDAPELALVVEAIRRVPRALLGGVAFPLAAIIERLAELKGDSRDLCLELWDLLLPAAAAMAEAEEESDLATSLTGSPLASLTTSLVALQRNGDWHEGEELDPGLFDRFNALLALPDRAALVAKAALMSEIAFLDLLSPSWVDEHLMPALSAEHPQAIAMMGRVANSAAPVPPRLFKRLKQAIFRSLEHEETEDPVREHLCGLLVGAAFAVIDGDQSFDLSAVECRRILTRVPSRVLGRMAWELTAELRDQESAASRAEQWDRRIGPFLARFWPNDVAARTEEVSSSLVRLPALAGDAFERAVDAVLGLVRPLPRLDVSFGLGLELDEGEDLVRQYPRGVLRLISSILDQEGPSPDGLDAVVTALVEADPQIVNLPAFWRLRSMQRL